MSLIEKINGDLKKAMLARDQFLTGVLRDLKSAFLYEEVAKNKRDTGLDDSEVETVIVREVKKRDDAITIYNQAGDKERADREVKEHNILQAYLPEPLSDDELNTIIDDILSIGEFGPSDMGRVIGSVKSEVGSRADGAKIAMIVKEKLNR